MKVAALLLLLLVTMTTAVILPIPAPTVDSEGLLITSICHDYKDCIVTTEGEPLALSCYYSVNKCNCYNTYRSDYHIGVSGDQCLMSKYGPCGTNINNTFTVGCRDNFECIDGRCRDPADPSRTVKSAYQFPVESCNACQFSDDLELECKGSSRRSDLSCKCEVVDIPDKPGTFWDLRNYDGDNNCSTGWFGPCGVRNGIEIGCHGDGIKCVNGKCTNTLRPNPVSAVGEPCAQTSDCQASLTCSSGFTCIVANSVPEGGRCGSDEECQEGLICGFDHNWDPYNPSVCKRSNGRGNFDYPEPVFPDE